MQFQCQAWILPEPGRLMAKADLSLELPSTGAAALFPEPLLRRTGDLALSLVTDRLEKRCRAGLMKEALNWIARHS